MPNVQPSMDASEHRSKNVEVKGVLLHGYDSTGDTYVPLNVDSSGSASPWKSDGSGGWYLDIQGNGEILHAYKKDNLSPAANTALAINDRDITYSNPAIGVTFGGENLSAPTTHDRTFTFDADNWATGAYNFSPKIVFSEDSNVFATGILFGHSATYINDSSFTPTNPGPVYTMVDNAKLTADTTTTTYFARTVFWDESQATTVNSGTLNITDYWGFRAGNSAKEEIGSGVTVTNRYKFYSDNSINNGTITNNYAFFSKPQTEGTNNYGVVIGAASTNTLWISNNANNTTAAAGIVFGSSKDTNLYRSGANILRTDDTMRARAFRADNAGSGLAGTTTFTNATGAPTSDPGWTSSSTVDMTAPNGYIKAYVGTQRVSIPYWNTT